MEMAAREARAKEVGGRLHRPHRPQGTNPPDGTTTARAPGQAPHVGHVTNYSRDKFLDPLRLRRPSVKFTPSSGFATNTDSDRKNCRVRL